MFFARAMLVGLARSAAIVAVGFALAALVVFLSNACGSSAPRGSYEVDKVEKGIQDAVDAGDISGPQGDKVARRIAVANPGFDWGKVWTGVSAVALSLGGAYIGLRPALSRTDNRHILGEEAAAVLAELVEQRRIAKA